MEEAILLVPLHLTDAHRLRLAGFQLTLENSLTAWRNRLRDLLLQCDHQVWICERGTDAEAVIGVQVIDPVARRAVLHLYASSAELRQDILLKILRQCFLVLGLYRLEFAIPAAKIEWLPVLRSTGLQEEGVLRNCRFDPDSNRHQDVLLYSILRPEYSQFGSAFIPFSKGLFVITGDSDAIKATEFVHYGDSFASAWSEESAELLGLLDSCGKLADRDKLQKLLAGSRNFMSAHAPATVIRAADQAADYFAGKLTNFDLPLDISQGSEFQQKVWQTLANIPYGSTWTYEELAYQLQTPDWLTARKMSRAVGSACGANPLPLILPCHRVIGKDGRLTGFSGGLDIKEYLLDHEIMGLND